jgi:hypothetical protein
MSVNAFNGPFWNSGTIISARPDNTVSKHTRAALLSGT